MIRPTKSSTILKSSANAPILQILSLALGLLLAVLSPRGSAADIAQQHGFSEPVKYRTVLANAIGEANTVLKPTDGIVLEPGWLGPQAGSVPVYLVRGEEFSPTEVAQVPLERCVFVNSDGIPYLRRLFAGYGTAGLDVSLRDALAVVLLHECGHLFYGEHRDFTPGRRLGAGVLNTKPTPAKSSEERADIFAAVRIRDAVKQKVGRSAAATARFSTGLDLMLACGDASWNIASQRMLGQFSADALHLKDLYQDHGYTHPDWELRFLLINVKISPNASARRLLTQFLQWRNQPLSGPSHS